MSCVFCSITTAAYDHSACAFISDLAAMRGISFAQARAQYDEQNLIDATEAKVLDDEPCEPAMAMPIFNVAEARLIADTEDRMTEKKYAKSAVNKMLDYMFSRKS